MTQKRKTVVKTVVKRNKKEVAWDQQKIVRAISLAYYDVASGGQENPHRDDPEAGYGLLEIGREGDFAKAQRIADKVEQMARKWRKPTIEQVQDLVELALLGECEIEAAKNYILYRARQADRRFNHYPENGMSEYVRLTKYARHRPDKRRRETLEESVARVRKMHEQYIKDRGELGQLGSSFDKAEFTAKLKEAFSEVNKLVVWPSSRTMQFGGSAVLDIHERAYNCSFTPIDRPRAFAEIIYLLLAGCGVGFSVQKHHIAELPVFPARRSEVDLPVYHFVIPDTIQGWAEAVELLFRSYVNGYKVEFSYHQIRDRGLPLKTSGGKAPGHIPLKNALNAVESVLEKCAGRRMRPIEAYDCVMYLAEAVLSGGIRRSATLCEFSPDDEEMAAAKTGDWMQTHPQRQYSNNSVMLVRNKTKREQFSTCFNHTKEYGEPGFIWAEHEETGYNPCGEVGLYAYLHVDKPEIVDQLRARGYRESVSVGDVLSGVQMCNLTTINGTVLKTREDFFKACELASFLGTLQAAYTNFPFLGPVTEMIVERDALLGVSITGFMDNAKLLFDPEVLQTGAKIVLETNAYWAERLGINKAARATVVKPEGTAAKVLGSASGIHCHHAKRYIQRIRASKIETPYQHFKKINEHMTEVSVSKPDYDEYINFPVEAPDGAILRGELTATEFLERVKLVYENWVIPGTREFTYGKGITHNVSNTVDVMADEWPAVEEYMWQNKQCFAAVSFLPFDGEKKYIQAPKEAIGDDPEDAAKWNRLEYKPVVWENLKEDEDDTQLKESFACVGGQCEI